MTNKILDTGRRVGLQAREKLLGDRSRAAVARISGSAKRAGQSIRDRLLPKARESVRQSVDRLVKAIRR